MDTMKYTVHFVKVGDAKQLHKIYSVISKETISYLPVFFWVSNFTESSDSCPKCGNDYSRERVLLVPVLLAWSWVCQFIHFPVVQCDTVAITGTLNLFICYAFRIVIAIFCLICRGTHVNKNKRTYMQDRSWLEFECLTVVQERSMVIGDTVKSSKYADSEITNTFKIYNIDTNCVDCHGNVTLLVF